MTHTPGPWEYVPSTEHHGPYVTSEYGSTICDFYTMSRPDHPSTRNGGASKPIHHMHEMADHNARLAAAAPAMLAALRKFDAWEQDPDRYAGDLADLVCEARAAIAAAMGKD